MSKEQFLAENIKPGEIYAGLILGTYGQPDYHLVLLPEESNKDLNWDEAMAWAKTTGVDLPTRRDQSLLFVNCKTQFKPEGYWSNEQNAINPVYTWMQYFDDGDQYNAHKSDEYRALAVRRIYI